MPATDSPLSAVMPLTSFVTSSSTSTTSSSTAMSFSAVDIHKLMKEKSDWMKEKSDLIKEKSDWMKEKSDLMKEKSDWMKEKSDLMKEKSDWMKEKSDLIKENNNHVRAKNQTSKHHLYPLRDSNGQIPATFPNSRHELNNLSGVQLQNLLSAFNQPNHGNYSAVLKRFLNFIEKGNTQKKLYLTFH